MRAELTYPLFLRSWNSLGHRVKLYDEGKQFIVQLYACMHVCRIYSPETLFRPGMEMTSARPITCFEATWLARWSRHFSSPPQHDHHAASAHPRPPFLTLAFCCAMPTTEVLASNGALPVPPPLQLKPTLNGHTPNGTSDRLQIINNEKEFTCVYEQLLRRLMLREPFADPA